MAASKPSPCAANSSTLPTRGPLVRPVIRVAGEWEGKVHVQSEGRRVEDVVRLDDGSRIWPRPLSKHPVWAYDFVADRTQDRRPARR